MIALLRDRPEKLSRTTGSRCQQDMRMQMIVCFMVLCLFAAGNGGKILLVAVPGRSHVHYVATAGKELIDNGHEVHLILTTSISKMAQELSLLIDPSITVYTVKPDMEEFTQDDKNMTAQMNEVLYYVHKFGIKSIMIQRILGLSFVRPLCHNLLNDEELFLKLKTKDFDIALIDGFPLTRCFYVLLHRLGIPYVSLTTQYEPWRYGIPSPPSFVPLALEHSYTEQMTFFQRVRNFLSYVEWHTIPLFYSMSGHYTSQYAPEMPYKTPNQLASDSALWFINTDIAIDYARPSLPHVIEVGGLTTKPPNKPLPQEFKSFLDNSGDEGAIVISFGSSPGFPDDIELLIHDTVLRLKQRVIWKTTQSNLTGESVMTNKWIPQNAILAHPKVKLFITHGGNNGQFEALYHGVPMVVIPLFGDQFYNAERVKYKGYGLVKAAFETTVDDLIESIDEVMKNPIYKENISRGSKIYRSHPMNPRERLVYWMEHAMKYGSDHLHSHGLQMPWYQYWVIDIIVFLFICLTVACFITYKSVSFCRKRCKKTSKTEKRD